MKTKQGGLALSVWGISVMVAAGCSEQTSPPSPIVSCIEQAFRAVLHFDAADPRQVWATDLETGRDVVVRPRSGLVWMLDPGPPTRLLDADRRVVANEGDITISGCFEAASRTYSIGPDDLPPPDRPPN